MSLKAHIDSVMLVKPDPHHLYELPPIQGQLNVSTPYIEIDKYNLVAMNPLTCSLSIVNPLGSFPVDDPMSLDDQAPPEQPTVEMVPAAESVGQDQEGTSSVQPPRKDRSRTKTKKPKSKNGNF